MSLCEASHPYPIGACQGLPYVGTLPYVCMKQYTVFSRNVNSVTSAIKYNILMFKAKTPRITSYSLCGFVFCPKMLKYPQPD